MKNTFLVAVVMMVVVLPVSAVEFLGVALCRDSISTSVVLPEGSPLRLESVEVGDQGALVLLLTSDDTKILKQIDDLMTGFTGSRGVGDDASLQWSGRKITGFAQVLKPKVAALAVSTTDDCRDEVGEGPAEIQTALVVPAVETATPATIMPVPVAPPEKESAVVAPETAAMAPEAGPQFELEGVLQHRAFSDEWVDVMGVVVNNTDDSFVLATFDLSLYDENGRLICVDSISVSVLKSGQHRAFRDSIQCPEYAGDAVVRTELQFAGGR